MVVGHFEAKYYVQRVTFTANLYTPVHMVIFLLKFFALDAFTEMNFLAEFTVLN